MTPVISMIAAVARNGVIGASGGIPWKTPSDIAFFKHTTLGKPIVMGRKQFETVGKPLPGRANIVVSRQAGYQPDGVLVISDPFSALEHAKTIAQADGADEVMIIGGGEIYSLLMPAAERLYISHIEAEPEGDTVFPAIDPAVWAVADEPFVEPSPNDSAAFRVRVYERR